MGIEDIPRIKRESIEVKTWGEFRKALEGWVWCDADYCPDCYKKLIAKYREAGGKNLELNIQLIADAMDSRKVSDGWLVTCDDCGKSVFRTALKTKD